MAKKQAKVFAHRMVCEACGNEWHEGLVRECPKKRGHYICRYCCFRCKWVKKVGGMTGCAAFERKEG